MLLAHQAAIVAHEDDVYRPVMLCHGDFFRRGKQLLPESEGDYVIVSAHHGVLVACIQAILSYPMKAFLASAYPSPRISGISLKNDHSTLSHGRVV